jgi:hypothetical protein
VRCPECCGAGGQYCSYLHFSRIFEIPGYYRAIFLHPIKNAAAALIWCGALLYQKTLILHQRYRTVWCDIRLRWMMNLPEE